MVFRFGNRDIGKYRNGNRRRSNDFRMTPCPLFCASSPGPTVGYCGARQTTGGCDEMSSKFLPH
jgi:hypothetical protein